MKSFQVHMAHGSYVESLNKPQQMLMNEIIQSIFLEYLQ